MKKEVLVTLANEAYLTQVKQLFAGALFNGLWEGDFALIAYDIPDEKLTWFKEKGVVIFHCEKVPEEFACTHSPAIMVAKFHLFTEFFKQWKKVVYMDSDIIIRGPIDILKKVDHFAAAPDMVEVALSHQFATTETDPTWNEEKNKIFTEVFHTYNLHLISLNGGVFGIDTSIISKNTFGELMTILQRIKPIARFGEQTVLNLYFYGVWQKYPAKYNYFIAGKTLPPDLPDYVPGVILHFAGKAIKPWDEKSLFHTEWLLNLKKADQIESFSKGLLK